MSPLFQFADRLTVRTPIGEQEFGDVYAEIVDGTLVLQRDSRTVAWFAAGMWTEVSFR